MFDTEVPFCLCYCTPQNPTFQKISVDWTKVHIEFVRKTMFYLTASLLMLSQSFTRVICLFLVNQPLCTLSGLDVLCIILYLNLYKYVHGFYTVKTVFIVNIKPMKFTFWLLMFFSTLTMLYKRKDLLSITSVTLNGSNMPQVYPQFDCKTRPLDFLCDALQLQHGACGLSL